MATLRINHNSARAYIDIEYLPHYKICARTERQLHVSSEAAAQHLSNRSRQRQRVVAEYRVKRRRIDANLKVAPKRQLEIERHRNLRIAPVNHGRVGAKYSQRIGLRPKIACIWSPAAPASSR